MIKIALCMLLRCLAGECCVDTDGIAELLEEMEHFYKRTMLNSTRFYFFGTIPSVSQCSYLK